MFLLLSCFIYTMAETKSPECDLGSTDPVVCVDWFCSVRFFEVCLKKKPSLTQKMLSSGFGGGGFVCLVLVGLFGFCWLFF